MAVVPIPGRWLRSPLRDTSPVSVGTTGDAYSCPACHVGSGLAYVTDTDVCDTSDEASRKRGCELSPSEARPKLITKPHVLMSHCQEPSS